MRYLAHRLIHATLLLLAISFFSFALLQLAPGDYFDSMRLNPQMSRQTLTGMRSEYGLDRPLPVRYGHWLVSLLHGQLGVSLASRGPVAPVLRVRARNTLVLSGTATLFAWLLALPIGIWSATKRGGWADRIWSVATSALLTIPDLVLFLGLLLLAIRTGWFPTGGMRTEAAADLGLWSSAKDFALHLILPAFGVALVSLPVLVRHIRAAMIEALDSPFLRAARGHGIPNSLRTARRVKPTDLAAWILGRDDVERLRARGNRIELAGIGSASGGIDSLEGCVCGSRDRDAFFRFSCGGQFVCGPAPFRKRSADSNGVTR